LGAVARWLAANGREETLRMVALSARLREILATLPGVEQTVPMAGALDNTVHLRLPVDAESVLIRLDMHGVCASMGSACSAGVVKPSSTLEAMGWTPGESRRALRISLGWSTTEAQVDAVGGILGQILTNSATRGKTSS
jgi:cysteine desulfurase